GALARALRETSLPTHRDQDRIAEVAGSRGRLQLGAPGLPAVPGGFRNTPDTDLSTPVNQQWAAQITHRIRGSELGQEEARAARLTTVDAVESTISRALAAQPAWAGLAVEKRAGILRRVAGTLAAHRAELLEVMAAETG